MVGHILFIVVLWGPCAVLGWQKSSHFPYQAIAYMVAAVFGLWNLLSEGPEMWVPFLVALYGLYVISGGFYWLHEEGDPEVLNFDWKKAIFGP